MSRHYSRRTEQTYCHVIGREVSDLGEVIRARKPKRLPVVIAVLYWVLQMGKEKKGWTQLE